MHPDEVIPIVAEVLDALAAAHDKGIVHRDLKPENVFLCERPLKRAKILDFGISKFAGSEDVSLTRTGTVMGSPLYMSPAQARGAREVGPPADLYAVGAILYEALGGTPPFVGTTYNEVIANVLMEPHRPLIELRPELAPELSRVIDSLLSKDPSQRPPNAETASSSSAARTRPARPTSRCPPSRTAGRASSVPAPARRARRSHPRRRRVRHPSRPPRWCAGSGACSPTWWWPAW
jgi:serine/threonine-protein kinase